MNSHTQKPYEYVLARFPGGLDRNGELDQFICDQAELCMLYSPILEVCP